MLPPLPCRQISRRLRSSAGGTMTQLHGLAAGHAGPGVPSRSLSCRAVPFFPSPALHRTHHKAKVLNARSAVPCRALPCLHPQPAGRSEWHHIPRSQARGQTGPPWQHV